MPAIDIVNQLLSDALEKRASDIHLESRPDCLQIRFRIDGLLCEHQSIASDLALQVLARIKVLSRLDVAERRVPQDGKFLLQTQAGDLDLRVATFPGLNGEKMVIRILERSSTHIRTLSELGLSPDLYAHLERLITRATGFFLVTGPTGAGKTSTLYAALTQIASPQKNVVTLEDPIEYSLPGVTQGQIQAEVGFTFARGIRALVRQDPDIIMVGEIRDRETAETAVQAALTGHFVMSTLHTNDAPGTIMRLLDMGVPAFLLNATLSGVLAQRLVRVLCAVCKYESDIDDQERSFLTYVGITVDRAYRADGCSACEGRGYKGRTGIFELLMVSSALRSLVTSQPSYEALYAQARTDGMVPLKDNAAYKIASGITSISELARVIW